MRSFNNGYVTVIASLLLMSCSPSPDNVEDDTATNQLPPPSVPSKALPALSREEAQKILDNQSEEFAVVFSIDLNTVEGRTFYDYLRQQGNLREEGNRIIALDGFRDVSFQMHSRVQGLVSILRVGLKVENVTTTGNSATVGVQKLYSENAKIYDLVCNYPSNAVKWMTFLDCSSVGKKLAEYDVQFRRTDDGTWVTS